MEWAFELMNVAIGFMEILGNPDFWRYLGGLMILRPFASAFKNMRV